MGDDYTELMANDPDYHEWLDEQGYYWNTINQEENEMADMSQFASGESKDLKAKDFIGKNMKVKISDVKIRDYPETDDQPASSKPVLSFEGKEKGLVLNATNTKTLCEAYGNDSDEWINHEIGLTVADYTDKGFGHGWVVKPLDVKEPEFDDAIPF